MRFITKLLPLVGLALVLSLPVRAAAQPPINGFNGTLAPEGLVDEEYGIANTVIVGTTAGFGHLWHGTKALFVHHRSGDEAAAVRQLHDGLRVDVDEGSQTEEGTVVDVDRQRQHITIALDNGEDEYFQVTPPAAQQAGVTIYYADDTGRRVVHLFLVG